MKVVFEIGANLGMDVEKYLMDPDTVVYAAEPTPDLCYHLWRNFGGSPRFHLIPAAIDVENRFNRFNISPSSGCNSLHQFTDNIMEKWPGHDELHFVGHYEKIMCLRLDTIMDMFNIEKIDYLEIDTQGNDFNVLKSLGNRIGDVVAGKCEAFAGDIDLYKSSNRFEEVSTWLNDNGFDVTNCPHVHTFETDLHFVKR